MAVRVSHGARFTWKYDPHAKQWHCTHGSVYFERGEGWWLLPALHQKNNHYGPYTSRAVAMEEAERHFPKPEHDSTPVPWEQFS